MYLVLEEFSKKLSFLCFIYHDTSFFSLGSMSEQGILKENSVAVIKRNIHNVLKQFYMEES